jgi:hypothetical protein
VNLERAAVVGGEGGREADDPVTARGVDEHGTASVRGVQQPRPVPSQRGKHHSRFCYVTSRAWHGPLGSNVCAVKGCAALTDTGSCLPLASAAPCQRLAAEDAESAAQPPYHSRCVRNYVG